MRAGDYERIINYYWPKYHGNFMSESQDFSLCQAYCNKLKNVTSLQKVKFIRD